MSGDAVAVAVAVAVVVAVAEPPEEAVAGAVHGLEEVALDLALVHAVREITARTPLGRELVELCSVDHRGVLALLVVGKMTAGAIEVELADVWREDLVVSLLAEFFADEVLELLSDHRTVGGPEHESLADLFIDVEEF